MDFRNKTIQFYLETSARNLNKRTSKGKLNKKHLKSISLRESMDLSNKIENLAVDCIKRRRFRVKFNNNRSQSVYSSMQTEINKPQNLRELSFDTGVSNKILEEPEIFETDYMLNSYAPKIDNFCIDTTRNINSKSLCKNKCENNKQNSFEKYCGDILSGKSADFEKLLKIEQNPGSYKNMLQIILDDTQLSNRAKLKEILSKNKTTIHNSEFKKNTENLYNNDNFHKKFLIELLEKNKHKNLPDSFNQIRIKGESKLKSLIHLKIKSNRPRVNISIGTDSHENLIKLPLLKPKLARFVKPLNLNIRTKTATNNSIKISNTVLPKQNKSYSRRSPNLTKSNSKQKSLDCTLEILKRASPKVRFWPFTTGNKIMIVNSDTGILPSLHEIRSIKLV